METVNKSNDNKERMIREAMRKIVLGRSVDRIDMAPSGTSGIGTARMIHGYVAKIHDDPSDEEYEDYAGTIDVGEFPDETASSEPIIYKGVLLSGIKDNSGGFLIIPTLYSDVTIVSDAATKYTYVLNFSHADFIQLNAHEETVIGAAETEEFDPEDANSPDYNELAKTGNETFTKYTISAINTVVQNKDGEKAEINVIPTQIEQKIGKSEITQTEDKIASKIGNTSISLSNGRVSLGDENATEPLVLGNELAQLMLEFLTECSKITTPTLMGTMPALNIPNFTSLTSKIQNFLSKTSYTK